jgi:hypothetical protein
LSDPLNSRVLTPLKDGDAVGSRVRITAAACLVASGLLAGGASASVAFADPVSSGDAGDKHTNDSVRNGSAEKPKSGFDDKKTPPPGDGMGGQSGTDPVHHPKAGSENKDGDNKDGDNDNGNNGNGHRGHGGNGHNGNGGNGNGHNGNGNGHNGNGHNGNGHNGNGNGHNGNGHNGNGNGPGNGNGNGPGNGSGDNGNGDNGDGGNGTGNGNGGSGEGGGDPTDPGNCNEENKDDCSPGWPWWPWPVGQPPGPGGGGGGGGGHPEVPSGHPRIPPRMQLPPELMPPTTEPVGPSVIEAAPGAGGAAAELPIPPITLPVIVAPATGLGGGGSPGSPALPAAPRGVTAQPPAGREPLPANVGSNVAVPASSYRIGYTDYLRDAGLSQVAALAVPGVAGMLVLTGAGGLVGYRQAKAGHAVHTSGTARFVN